MSITLKPQALLNKYNAYIMAPYTYANFINNGIKISWGYELYGATLKALSASNNISMSDDMVAYMSKDIQQAVEMMKKGRQQKDTVIIGKNNEILQGADQVAVNLLFGCAVECTQVEPEKLPVDAFTCLKKGGLEEKYLDALALAYCQCNPDSHTSVIWPLGVPYHGKIKKMLEQGKCSIVYEKKIELSNRGLQNFLEHIPDKMRSGADHKNYFVPSEKEPHPLYIFLFDTTNDVESIRVCKEHIRSVIAVDPRVIHIDDYHDQSIQTACMAFSFNSIYFMNHAYMKNLKKFDALLSKFDSIVRKKGIDKNKLCIDHGSVLAAYGIRDIGDLDFIHDGYTELLKKYREHTLHMDVDINSHNSFYTNAYTNMSKEEIIYNPTYHFYFRTYKFMVLGLLIDIKNKLKRPKDINDLQLIEKHFKSFKRL